MSEFFIALLNMSVTASYVAVIVIAIRYVLGKLRVPKVFTYILWSVVLFRLVFPFSFESAFSLIPSQTQIISQNIITSHNPAIDSVNNFGDHTGIMQLGLLQDGEPQSTRSLLGRALLESDEAASVRPIQIALEMGAIIWLLGMAFFILYALISYLRLRRNLIFATWVKDNIFETDQITTPFVLGFIKPRIYLPIGLTAQETDYILKHELTHIKRFDHLIKPLAFLVLAVHWFNPLVWLSYFLMIKDMEMSCDERVMKETSGDVRADYSRTLLTLASKQSGLLSPLSFGESGVKSRVKNILNYKQPVFWVGVAVIVVIVALAISMITNPINDNKMLAEEEAHIIHLVESFGKKLSMVSLLGPKAEVVQNMEDNYSEYVSQRLINTWGEDPENAPGRLTSSPWPERIETTEVTKLFNDTYEIKGRIIELTSVEMEEGGVAASRLITLEVRKIGGSWLIDAVIMGPYEVELEKEDILPPSLDEDKIDPSNETMDGVDVVEIDDDQNEAFNEFALYVGDNYFPVRSNQAREIILEGAETIRFPAEDLFPGGAQYQTDVLNMSTIAVDDERGQGEIIISIFALEEATTPRGISIGDSLADLQDAYSGLTNTAPWVMTSEQWPSADLLSFNRLYNYSPEGFSLIRFYVQDKTIVAIQIEGSYGDGAQVNNKELLGVTGVFQETNDMSPRGANYKFIYLDEAGEEEILLDLYARSYYEVDFDDDGITELMVYLAGSKSISIGIYGVVDGEIAYMDVNERLGSKFSTGMENIGNIHREYGNYINATFEEKDGSHRSEVYKYINHELIYVGPFENALRR